MSPFNILLVEDNEGEIVLIRTAMAKANVLNTIDVVKDGEKAIQFLKKEGAYKDAQTPGLILLDINLPIINGKEVLSIIKQDATLRMIPVVMLTTSVSKTDIAESYYYHANCYISKPFDFNDFMAMVESLKSFWLSHVQIPEVEEIKVNNDSEN